MPEIGGRGSLLYLSRQKKVLRDTSLGAFLVTARLLPTQWAAEKPSKVEQDLAQLRTRLNPGPGPPEVPSTVRSSLRGFSLESPVTFGGPTTSQHLSAGEVKSKVFPGTGVEAQ